MDHSKLPKISVIVCTNRYDHFFELALSSLVEQTFQDFEIVIVANGMADKNYAALEKLGLEIGKRLSISLYRTALHGLTFSRNLALHHCRAPLVAIMDGDDIALPTRLAHQAAYMAEHPEISVCGSSYNIIDEFGRILAFRRMPNDDRSIRKALLLNNPFCHPTVMFRREVAIKVGGYTGHNAEDYELWLRLFEEPKIMFANIQEPLLGYRTAVTSTARRSRRAYVHVAGAQFRMLWLTYHPKWLFAAIVSAFKAIFRATRA